MTPLDGLRVLVTRAGNQASALADRLTTLGATPILVPTLELAPPDSWTNLDQALTDLGLVFPKTERPPAPYDWLVFTSANAVEALHARALATLGNPVPLARPTARIAAIGPATARAVTQTLGWTVDLIPSAYVAESLADALASQHPRSILLVRATHARDTLVERLGPLVTVAEAYQTRAPAGAAAALQALFARNPPDAITFTSASTVRHLLELAGPIPPGITLASIGPITSAALAEAGLTPTVEADEATIESLTEALIRWRQPLA